MRILELGCGTGDMWKNKEDLIRLCSRLTLSDFSKAMIAAAKSNIDDIIEYLYSLSSMTSITGIPKQAKRYFDRSYYKWNFKRAKRIWHVYRIIEQSGVD